MSIHGTGYNPYSTYSYGFGNAGATTPNYSQYQLPEKKEGAGVGTWLAIGTGALIGIDLLFCKGKNIKKLWGGIKGLFSKNADDAAKGASEAAEQVLQKNKGTSGLDITKLSKEAFEKSADDAADAFTKAQKAVEKTIHKNSKIWNQAEVSKILNNKNAIAKAVKEGTTDDIAKNLAKELGKDGDKATIKAAKELIESQYKADYTKALQELANATDKAGVDAIITKLPQEMQAHIKNGQGKLIKNILSKGEINGDDVETLRKMGVDVKFTTKDGKEVIDSIGGVSLADIKAGKSTGIAQIQSLNQYRNDKLTSLMTNFSKEEFEKRPDYYTALLKNKFGDSVTLEVTEKGLKIGGLDKVAEAAKQDSLYQTLVQTNEATEKALEQAGKTWTI